MDVVCLFEFGKDLKKSGLYLIPAIEKLLV
jgi:hypothetical protein